MNDYMINTMIRDIRVLIIDRRKETEMNMHRGQRG